MTTKERIKYVKELREKKRNKGTASTRAILVNAIQEAGVKFPFQEDELKAWNKFYKSFTAARNAILK